MKFKLLYLFLIVIVIFLFIKPKPIIAAVGCPCGDGTNGIECCNIPPGCTACTPGQKCCAGECVTGQQCPGETITCRAGTHDNGRCVPGKAINPPCCSPNATAPPGCPAARTCAKPSCGQPGVPVPDGNCGTKPCPDGAPCAPGVPTPPPPPPPPDPIRIGVSVYNDPDNDCNLSNDPPPTGPKSDRVYYWGWDKTDPVYNWRLLWTYLNGYRVNDNPNLVLQVALRERGGETSRRSGEGPYTVFLGNLPSSYRCSDGPSCPTNCPIQPYVYGEGSATFYITNQGAPPPPPPVLSSWWQVKDGDVSTNSDITSNVPAASYFNIVGLGGFPGVPVYGGSLTTGSGTTSATRWNANTTTALTRIFNYSYFDNLIPDDVTLNNTSLLSSGGVVSSGYEWFKANGNFTISSDINFGSRKVILFVEGGDLNINSKINLTDNQGFFGTFVDGNINVSGVVSGAGTPALEGIYLADSGFKTGLGSQQLHIRGSIASFGGITLERDLSDNSTAAELLEFAPDQLLLFPEKLMFKRTKWIEVAP